MVDCALAGTSSSVPHSKQVTCLSSGTRSLRLGSGRASSSSRKCPWHFLQTVEKAVRGSSWRWPQCGQATCTLSCLLAGIYPCPQSGGAQRKTGVGGAVDLGASPARGTGGGVALFGFTSVLPT